MRLIDADRLLCVIDDDGGWAYDGLEYQAYMSCLRGIQEDVTEAPTIDPETLRPTAYWNQLNESELTGWNPEFAGHDPIGSYECSNCHAEAVFNCDGEFVLSKYCLHCGAKMVNAEAENVNQ